MNKIFIRNLLLVLLFLLPQWFVYSQDNSKINYVSIPESAITFEGNNKITIYTLDLNTEKSTEIHGTYSMSVKYGVPFINITWENNTTDTFLMLSNNVACFLYKAGNQNPYLSGCSGSYNRNEGVFRSPESIKASSFLIENEKQYSPDQINPKLGQVWAEGKKGQGLHEKLFINPPYRCTALHISIGFVSFEKPYLYEENSRPKKLRVSVVGKFSFTADLDDTPNFQTIKLSQSVGEKDVLVIEILDVYQGTKYEDTCINFILYDTAPM